MTLRSNQRHINLNDPESFEIRTLSVERQLEQLVKQVTTLVNGKPSNYRKGQSKSGQALLEVSPIRRAKKKIEILLRNLVQ